MVRASEREQRKQLKVSVPTSLEPLSPLRLLGKGQFGRVISAINASNNKFAIKCVEKSIAMQNESYTSIMTERRVLSACHESLMIPNLYSSFQSTSHLYFALEIMYGGDLETHLKAKSSFGVSATRFYIAEILIGLWHLHDNGIIYRDLKPENILLDSKGHVKLTDFGLSKDNMMPSDTTSTLTGTPQYLAPEIVRSSPYNKSVDFWALGVVTYRLLIGNFPFQSPKSGSSVGTVGLFESILESQPQFPAKQPKSVTSFIEGLLQKQVTSRLGCNLQRGHVDLQSHPFLSSVDWDRAAAKGMKPPSRPQIRHQGGEDVSSQGVAAFRQQTQDDSEVDQSVFVGFDWVQNRPAVF